MDLLGEITRVRVRLITPERWYWVTFDRLSFGEETGPFPVLLEDRGDELILVTYPDMTKETFVGIPEICSRFNLRVFHFESDETN